jgi:hypothetical protein
MQRSEIFPSRYIKADDLPGPRVVTIAKAEMQPFKNDGREQEKLVVVFREKVKSLVVNLSNYDSISIECGLGDETNAWTGHKIELYATTTRFGTKTVPCVRVRPPAQPELAAKPRKPKAKPVPAAEPEPGLNDEIPW